MTREAESASAPAEPATVERAATGAPAPHVDAEPGPAAGSHAADAERGPAAALEAPATLPQGEPPMGDPGAPYRALPSLEVHAPLEPKSVPRGFPILGPLVFVFGALLWSFLVAGQLTSSWSFGRPLGEDVAALIVVAATAMATYRAMRRSAMTRPGNIATLVGRSIFVVGAAAVGLGLTVVLTTLLLGGADVLATLLLLALATASTFGGARMLGRDEPKGARERTLAFATWGTAGLVTFVAIIDLVVGG